MTRNDAAIIGDVIRNEAMECAKSSVNMDNTSENRNIFHVVSIILNGIADNLGAKRPTTKPKRKKK